MHSLRWKMIISTMFAVFVPVFLLNRYAIESLDRFTTSIWEAEMLDTATMCGEIYKSGLSEEKAFALMQRFSDETGMRIQLLDRRAALKFDSHPTDPAEPFAKLEEVAEALQGRYMARNKVTPDRNYMMYYGARPVKHDGEVIGVIYITRNTSPIMRVIKRMFDRQKYATLAALILAACVSAMVAMTLTHPLRRLTRATSAYARGDTPHFKLAKGRDEIGILAKSFESMAEEIEERNVYNRDFFKTVVHELRTPITAIKGATEVLDSDAGDEVTTRTRFTRNIRHQADRLTRLVGEMNVLTEIDAEGPRSPRERVDYTSLLKDIVSLLEPSFEESHATLHLDLPAQALYARVAPLRIEQVIANLLENAFRFTPNEGAVYIHVQQQGDVLVTEVRDSGSGISTENLDRVFDRFFTTQPRRSHSSQGSGLGLSICKRIIESHQGTITAKNSPDGGASIRFTLPAAG